MNWSFYPGDSKMNLAELFPEFDCVLVMGICYLRFVLCRRLVHKFFMIGIVQHQKKL